MPILEAVGVSYSYEKNEVLKDLSFSLEKGDFAGLLGPNGAGKSTLLRVLSGAYKPAGGKVLLFGEDLKNLKRKEIARKISFVPQRFNLDFPYTCREIVMMGRFSRLGALGLEGKEDRDRVEDIMKVTNTAHLADKLITHLSGGEQQRIILAQALVQETEILLLDEPTSNLDINYQVEILDLIKSLNRTQGISIIVAIHDMNLASQFLSRAVLLYDKRIYREGNPAEVISEKNIEEVFKARILVEKKEGFDFPIIVPVSKTYSPGISQNETPGSNKLADGTPAENSSAC